MGTFLSFEPPLIWQAINHIRTGRQASGSCNTEFILTALPCSRLAENARAITGYIKFRRVVSNVGGLTFFRYRFSDETLRLGVFSQF